MGDLAVTYKARDENLALRDAMQSLRRDGVTLAPWRMERRELAEMKSYLDDCTVWPAHVMSKADPTFHNKLRDARTEGQWPAFAPVMDDAVIAPHFFEYALRCYPIARDYFGEPPLLYSMNVFWTQPAPYRYGETHEWHRDEDDRKQLGLFLFGTDTTEDNGPHHYRRGSHRLPDGRLPPGDVAAIVGALDRAYGAEVQSPRPESVVTVIGPAGTMILEDPTGLHMGKRPQKARMFAWARWGVSNPPASYVWDKLRPCPKEKLGKRYPQDPELQEAIRLVVS